MIGKPGRLLNLSKCSVIKSAHLTDHLTVDCQVCSYVYRYIFHLFTFLQIPSLTKYRWNKKKKKKETATVKINTREKESGIQSSRISAVTSTCQSTETSVSLPCVGAGAIIWEKSHRMAKDRVQLSHRLCQSPLYCPDSRPGFLICQDGDLLR